MVLQATFSGDLPTDIMWSRTQFVFKNPVICKRLQIEFVKVSPDYYFSNNTECPVVNKIYFIGTLLQNESKPNFYYDDQNKLKKIENFSLGDIVKNSNSYLFDESELQSSPFQSHKKSIGNSVIEILPISNLTGNYANQAYIDSHRIPTNSFNYSSNGDKIYPISYAFTSQSYWISLEINDTFTSSIYINFSSIESIEAIIYDTVFTTTSSQFRKFHGFPNKVNIYTSLFDDEMELSAVFQGETPNTTSWGRMAQFVFKSQVLCRKMRIEFVEVSPDFFFSNGKNCACIHEIFFIGSVNPERNISYIDKIFIRDLGTDQIRAGESQLNIYQISGCKFIDIQNDHRNYLIKTLSEILFFDNVFENTELTSSIESSGIIWCSFDGRMNIINCKFIRIAGRGSEGFIITANSNNIVDLTLRKCEFIDCGRENRYGETLPLISMYNYRSSICFYECNFTFSNSSRSYEVLDIRSNNALFDHCRFVNCGKNTIYLSKDTTESYVNGIFQFTNNYVTSNNGNFINASKTRSKPIINNNTFENITIQNDFLIYISHNQEQIELINNTFSHIILSAINQFSEGGIT